MTDIELYMRILGACLVFGQIYIGLQLRLIRAELVSKKDCSELRKDIYTKIEKSNNFCMITNKATPPNDT